VDPIAIVRTRNWITHLRRQATLHERHRARIAAELAQLQADVRSARTQTRVLEKLKERRLSQHQRTRAIHEQELADEAARNLLLRRQTGQG
jgi:hypothetical protein